jgi:hypothetical protein
MNSADLTAAQLDALLQRVQGHVAFLQALLNRMEQQQFPQLDQLRLRTLMALDQLEMLQKTVERLAAERTRREELWSAKSTREFKRRWRDQRNG